MVPKEPNYLLGHGENLMVPIVPRRGGGDKYDPYNFADAKAEVSRRARATSQALDDLPRAACPKEQAVAVMTLHPAYLAKTYSPVGLLAAAGLRTIGSRGTSVVPRVPPKHSRPDERIGTTELFVAGTRRQFRAFAQNLPQWDESTTGAAEVIRIEDFRPPIAADRIREFRSDDANPLLEVALHRAGLPLDSVLEGFHKFLTSIELVAEFGRHLTVGSLLFLPLRLPRDEVPRIARYAFLRVAREMPSLRLSEARPKSFSMRTDPRQCDLPIDGPLDPNVVAAVFDGGLPESPCLETWVRSIDAKGVGDAVPSLQQHGLAVTSSLLFGSLDQERSTQVPYSRVDHYRVLDAQSQSDPQGQLYPVLERIVEVLKKNNYQYVNFSIGPEQPVEDDEVSAWTASLDQLFSGGHTLATAAVGNWGEKDAEAGLNRIQPPSDGVNILAIAACERGSGLFLRSKYSSIGPGRSPGRGKPDLSSFGGSQDDPFWVLKAGTKREVIADYGTSLASSYTLRVGLGVRASLGDALTPLAVHALMVHRSEESCGPEGDVTESRVAKETVLRLAS